LKNFTSSIFSALIGLPLGGYIGWYYGGTSAAFVSALFITAILAVLEISLSFDNAIVNAVTLKKMTPLWQKRFLTWGMLIAVFGMRLVFPLAIVSFATGLNPWAALLLALNSPDRYAEIMHSVHANVAAFGGCFLLLVALEFFYDENKDHHWIPWLEIPAVKLGQVRSFDMMICLTVLTVLSYFLSESQQSGFLISGLAGVIIFLAVKGLSHYLESLGGPNEKDLHKASFGAFLYLEVLDASFSFDGVVGAFAITSNLLIIMIGLSIGAFFVRSLTLMFVEKNTLTHFVYLEHGAFYAVGSLALMMLCDPLFHIPEWMTGLIGALFIGAAVYASIRHSKVIQQQQ
jgi:uncharacterized protein